MRQETVIWKYWGQVGAQLKRKDSAWAQASPSFYSKWDTPIALRQAISSNRQTFLSVGL